MNRRKLIVAGIAGWAILVFFANTVHLLWEVPFYALAGWAVFLVTVVPGYGWTWQAVVLFVVSLAVLAGLFFCVIDRLRPILSPDGRSGHNLRQDGSTRRTATVRISASLLAALLLVAGSGISLLAITHQAFWIVAGAPLTGTNLWSSHAFYFRGNMKSVAVGVLDAAEETRALLPGSSYAGTGQRLHGWLTPLLPYVDESVVAGQIDMSLPWNHGKNRAAFETPIAAYSMPKYTSVMDRTTDGYATAWLAANRHVIGPFPALRMEQVTDGLSNTLLAGEVGVNLNAWGDTRNFRDPGLGINKSPHGFTMPGSSGIWMTRVDGTVSFLSEDTSPDVLSAIATPSGGEHVDEKSF